MSYSPWLTNGRKSPEKEAALGNHLLDASRKLNAPDVRVKSSTSAAMPPPLIYIDSASSLSKTLASERLKIVPDMRMSLIGWIPDLHLWRLTLQVLALFLRVVAGIVMSCKQRNKWFFFIRSTQQGIFYLCYNGTSENLLRLKKCNVCVWEREGGG